jgi:membrane protein YdbS with pleckstrin-like domain
MFKVFRDWCERFLRIPGDPEPPPGDEARTQRFRAAPNYYRYLLVIWGLKTIGALCILLPLEIGPLLAAMELRDQRLLGAALIGLPQIIILLVVLGRIFSLALVRLDFEKRWYLVTDRSLRLREGILNVREMTITFANIQNISISQGPIQRALGIADLRVDTAGGSSASRHEGKGMPQNLHTAFFRGVENANTIREVIQKRLRALKDSGLGDHEEIATAGRPAATSVISDQILAALREVASEAAALRAAAAVAG